MKKLALSLALASALVGIGVAAAKPPKGPDSKHSIHALNRLARHFPTKDQFARELAGSTGTRGNLINHGGPTITTAHVIAIFWGPSWGSGAANTMSKTLAAYIANYGTTGEYN